MNKTYRKYKTEFFPVENTFTKNLSQRTKVSTKSYMRRGGRERPPVSLHPCPECLSTSRPPLIHHGGLASGVVGERYLGRTEEGLGVGVEFYDSSGCLGTAGNTFSRAVPCRDYDGKDLRGTSWVGDHSVAVTETRRLTVGAEWGLGPFLASEWEV